MSDGTWVTLHLGDGGMVHLEGREAREALTALVEPLDEATLGAFQLVAYRRGRRGFEWVSERGYTERSKTISRADVVGYETNDMDPVHD